MKKTNFFLLLIVQILIFISLSYGLVIENFNSKDGFVKNADTNSSADLYLSTSGYENQSVRMSYDITTGNYVQMYKDYSVQSWAGGDTLKFWFYGSGATNNLEIKLTDEDGSIFIKTLSNVTNNTSWTKVEVPLTDFSYGWGGDNVLDKTKIKKISFGVTKSSGLNGYIILDNITLYLSTPVVKVLDNFDDLNTTNNFGGTNSTWGSSCTVAYVSTVTYSGTGTAELSYDVSSSGNYGGFLLPLNNENISNTTHLSVYVKGLTGNENFLVKFENNFGWSAEKNVSDYISLSTEWQQVVIPLSDFVDTNYGNLLSTSTATMKLNIVFGNPLGTPYNSKIYLDEIKFLVPGTAGTDVKVIDSMDDSVGKLSSWSGVGDAVKSLENVDGYSNDAIKLNYDFTSANDTWALIERVLSLNFSYYTHLLLKYNGDFNGNTIEIKLTDSDGTTYWKKIFNVTSTTDWQTIKVPIKEFSYFTKDATADTTLNLKEITKVWLVVSKGSSVSGENKGNVYFDQIELVQEPEFQTTTGNIVSFEVKNNPFSPNSDGLKDKIYFNYKLKDFATVKLEIYNLRGELVKTFSEGEKQPNQDFTIEWDGKDNDNKLLKNGIYVYRFVIKLLDGRQEEVKHIVGIVK